MVVSEPERGYGRACLKGFTTAKNLGADFVIFMDGDGSDDPADLPAMLAPVIEGLADFSIGSRVSYTFRTWSDSTSGSSGQLAG